MMNLKNEDRQQLIALLKDIPELSNERSRRQFLTEAGLTPLLPRLDLSGTPFVAISEIITNLLSYGRLSYDREALGVFLNALKTFNIFGVQQQQFVDRLLTDYEMMTPIATLPPIDQWQGRETPTDIFEKIIGESTLRPIAFLQQGINVARSVAYIGVRSPQGSWSGSGFLIGADLLLTNHHVLPRADLLPHTIFRFNYEENFQGEAQQPEEYRAQVDGIFQTNSALDYTVVQLVGEPGTQWGWLSLVETTIRRRERVNIIQHPLGQPKQISLQNNFVEYLGGDVVQYVTSTLNGSSGSPVFNDRWDVVALHHAGGNILEPTTQRRYFRNEGILVSRILADLPPELAERIRSGATA